MTDLIILAARSRYDEAKETARLSRYRRNGTVDESDRDFVMATAELLRTECDSSS